MTAEWGATDAEWGAGVAEWGGSAAPRGTVTITVDLRATVTVDASCGTVSIAALAGTATLGEG